MTLRSIKTRIAGAIGAALLGSFGIPTVIVLSCAIAYIAFTTKDEVQSGAYDVAAVKG